MKLTPCQSPDRDPEDWFIETNGKQYREDSLLSPVEEVTIRLASRDDETLEDVQKAVDLAASAAKRQALIRRRKARESCREECALRHECLRIRLEDMSGASGTWGGYYPEELEKIDDLKLQRDRRA